MNEKIKILFLAADPVDVPHLRLGSEVKEIAEKIRSASHRDAFELVSEWAVTVRDLSQVLLRHCPHIVHFSGHGSASGALVVEDESGKARMVDPEALTDLLQILKDNIRVVVLNACFSGPQADAIKQVIDYTIGMERTVTDKAAILFSVMFYNTLGFGRTVNEAFKVARLALKLEFPQDHNTPVLLTRDGLDSASGYLIEPAPDPALTEILALDARWVKERDPWKRYWLAVSIGEIGGKKAIEVLRRIRAQEADEFARMGVEEGLRSAGGLVD